MFYLQLEIYESDTTYFKRFLSFGINNKSPFSGCPSCFTAFEVLQRTPLTGFQISQTKTIKINRRKQYNLSDISMKIECSSSTNIEEQFHY